MFNWLRLLTGSKRYKRLVVIDLKMRKHLPFWIAFIKVFKLINGIKTTDSTITHIDLGEILFEFKTDQYVKFDSLPSLLYQVTNDREFQINMFEANDYVRLSICHEETIKGYEI